MLGHKSVNGKYQSSLTFDKSEGFGMQMSKQALPPFPSLNTSKKQKTDFFSPFLLAHSIDSFITDSANSATALMSGHKSTVNALNAYTDSTGVYDNNPAFETVFEMGRRIYNAKIGIVTTAYLADATPAAVAAHTAKRSEYDLIIGSPLFSLSSTAQASFPPAAFPRFFHCSCDFLNLSRRPTCSWTRSDFFSFSPDQFLEGVKGKPWTKWDGPDVIFGAGGRYFMPNAKNGNVSQIDRFVDAGYKFVHDNTTLSEVGNEDRVLGIFSSENLPTWLDRHILLVLLFSFSSFSSTNFPPLSTARRTSPASSPGTPRTRPSLPRLPTPPVSRR
jgi:alkaline phosphatase